MADFLEASSDDEDLGRHDLKVAEEKMFNSGYREGLGLSGEKNLQVFFELFSISPFWLLNPKKRISPFRPLNPKKRRNSSNPFLSGRVQQRL